MKWKMRYRCRMRGAAVQTFRDGGQWPRLARASKRRRYRRLLKGSQHARKWKIRIIPDCNRRGKAVAHGPYHYGWFYHGRNWQSNILYSAMRNIVGRSARSASFPKSFVTVESTRKSAPLRALKRLSPSVLGVVRREIPRPTSAGWCDDYYHVGLYWRRVGGTIVVVSFIRTCTVV